MVRRVSPYLFGGAKALSKADVVLATTEETKDYIQKYRKKPIYVMQSIGISKKVSVINKKHTGKLRILMSGRFIYWKAFDIGINAVIDVIDQGVDVEMTILGKGPQRDKLMKLASKYHEYIEFVDWIEFSKMDEFYSEFDLLLNTSLHDSGCMVVLEGMANSLPAIVVNTGGPKIITTMSTSRRVEPKSYTLIVNEIRDNIIDFYYNRHKLERLSEEGVKRVNEHFLFEKKAKIIDKYYLEAINSKKKS